MGRGEEHDTEQLAAAFAEFERTSEHLSRCYRDLEMRVAELTAALGQSRQRLDQELQEKAQLTARLSSLLDALPAGVVVLDSSGCVQSLNPTATDLLGDIPLGTAWGDIVMRLVAPRPDDGHDVSLRNGRRVNVATEALRGEPGQIVLLNDVTETRRLQDLVEHHRRLSAKTEMAAALAHQIRTPLATALLHLSNLDRHIDDAERRDRSVTKAKDSLRQLERLVEDMLTFARGGVFEHSTLRVPDLLNDIEQAVGNLTKNIDFKLGDVTAVEDTCVAGNHTALLSLMQNLINNAQHAASDGVRLCLEVIRDERFIHFRFADNGPGIEPRHVQTIFEPFFTTHKSGTGLGLSVAKAIARAHRGDLVLDTSYEHGACFVLSLPVAIPVPAAPNAPCLAGAADAVA